jgi:hypothetical protein
MLRKKKAPGRTLVYSLKSSLGGIGRKSGPAFYSPSNFLATLSTFSASALELITALVFLVYSETWNPSSLIFSI